MHQNAPDYMESKETVLTIFGCFHIWRNRAPTTNLSKVQRFGDINYSSGNLQLHQHPPEYSESTKTRIAILESKAINSQQLFSHQAWNDFDHYFSNHDVSKKLYYSIKPSKYKAIIPALEYKEPIMERL
ncbi:hypothetical protein F2Q70_00038064 [Brassica cretica]|uniref:Uncharacterized protein n=1 Tax=Brassica cretica TaxID=69181 RepID=A0A8S9K0M1_BRACR|nr:hypothetical protein F2Q70_00038064 [Brassica cretica]